MVVTATAASILKMFDNYLLLVQVLLILAEANYSEILGVFFLEICTPASAVSKSCEAC